MNDDKVTIAVTPDEWKLVASLRDIPSSPLRELLGDLIRELFAYARQPGCPEMQADGVPCESPSADCEQCRHVEAMLRSLREAIARSSARHGE